MESGTNPFECDERSNSRCLSYCFIHSTVTVFTVPYPGEQKTPIARRIKKKSWHHAWLSYHLPFALFDRPFVDIRTSVSRENPCRKLRIIRSIFQKLKKNFSKITSRKAKVYNYRSITTITGAVKSRLIGVEWTILSTSHRNRSIGSKEKVEKKEKKIKRKITAISSNYPMIVRHERDSALIEVGRVSTVRSESLDFPSSRLEFVVWEVLLPIRCVTRRATYLGILRGEDKKPGCM